MLYREANNGKGSRPEPTPCLKIYPNILHLNQTCFAERQIMIEAADQSRHPA
jgi:hypothetical protein